MAGRDRSQLLFGVFLAVIGLMLLLSTLGVIRGFNWWLLVRLWPLLLIFIGLNLLFKSTRLWWIVPLLFVLVIVSLFVTDHPYRRNFYFPRIDRDFHFSPFEIGNNNSTYRSSAEMTAGIKSLEVKLGFEAGRLDIKPLQDNGLLYNLDFRYQDERPEVQYYRSDGNGSATLSIGRERNQSWNIGDNGDEWLVNLSGEIPLKLDINAGAGQFNLDLKELQLRDLTINVGAGDLNLSLGMENSKLVLNSGATNVQLRLPRELGVEIKTTGVISSNNFSEVGLSRDGNLYHSANYQEAAIKLEMVVTAAASRIELSFY